MCNLTSICLLTLHGTSRSEHAESRYDELKDRMRPLFIEIRARAHRATGRRANPVILGKHHSQIEFDHMISRTADNQEARAGLGVLAEAEGQRVRRLGGLPNRPGIANFVAVNIEGYVNFLSGKNRYPSFRQHDRRDILKWNLHDTTVVEEETNGRWFSA